jgi:ABC-2 type transport system ATP-binding protein
MRSLSPPLALAALALLAPTASARDQVVTSFDGTPISTSFFPAAGLKPGQRAPTVLMTHGWGGSRQTDENAASSESVGSTGVGPLRKAGFNVLTWDSRGFGESGGTVEVDSMARPTRCSRRASRCATRRSCAATASRTS